MKALLPVLLMLTACHSEHRVPSTPEPMTETPAAVETHAEVPHGKPSAPVTVTADIKGQLAHVTVRFESAATAVDIVARGVRGVVVKDGALLQGGTVAPAAVLTYDVQLAVGAPEGEALLVIDVTGEVGGSTKKAVRAFVVAKADKAAQPPATITVDGQKLQLSPARP